jgi:hypothetical protein
MARTQNVTYLIIGGGLSGLTLASELSAKESSWLLVDKGRGWGGRLATRRTDDSGFHDHGAPEIHLSDRTLERLRGRWPELVLYPGLTARDARSGWRPGPGFGMTEIPKHMAHRLTSEKLCLNTRVSALRQSETGRLFAEIENSEERIFAQHVFLSCPIEQSRQLIADVMEIPEDWKRPQHSPCLSLLFSVPQGISPKLISDLNANGSVSRAFVSSRTENHAHCTVQMTADWSADAWPLDESGRLQLLLRELNLNSTALTQGHQLKAWRYAEPVNAVAEPFWSARTKGDSWVTCFGDVFCDGLGAESAFRSAWAVAESLSR